jgi:hypothetical protein
MKLALIASLLLAWGAGVSAKPVKIDRDSSALQFEYQWSSEAGAIPALNRILRAKAEAGYRMAIRYAREDERSAKKDKRPFHQHYYDVNWETHGETGRLLALGAVIETFTGGAHPMHNFDAILWDRRAGNRIGITDLFIRPSAFAKLTRSAYCRALDKERLERRQGEKLDGEFGECPKYSDLTIGPRDRQPNGRFESIEFVAAPYTAGPYVEGEYAIDLPVTRQLIAAMKPIYRASFEPQRQ